MKKCLKIIVIIILIIVLVILIKLKINQSNRQKEGNLSFLDNDVYDTENSSLSIETIGNKIVTSEEILKEKTYESLSPDESTILVKDGGNALISDTKINKTGDSTNTKNSELYGVNSTILVKTRSSATIKNTEINASAEGANAVFSTGEGSKIYISDSKIISTGNSYSRGLDATYGGYIEANNINILTQGVGSPLIYSNGKIIVSNSEGNASSAQIAVIEGKNTATIKNSNLKCSGIGIASSVDNCGILIYQSMSEDETDGIGKFNAVNSNLSIDKDSNYYKTAPFFFVTNTKATINLENNNLFYGSNLLLKIKGTDKLSKSKSNGGEVTLNATNQKLIGNIELDNISTLEMNLTNGSSLEGTINSDNTAKSISLSLDNSTKLTLTGNSYLTSLTDTDSSYSNINFNGYKLYVNGIAIN